MTRTIFSRYSRYLTKCIKTAYTDGAKKKKHLFHPLRMFKMCRKSYYKWIETMPADQDPVSRLH